MSYQLYRNTTLGHTLQEALDDLITFNQIPASLASKVLLQFDKCMNQALATRVKSRLTFKAGKLHTYRFCDNVWTFLLNDVEFREVHEVAKADKVKIVACDGKGVGGGTVGGGTGSAENDALAGAGSNSFNASSVASPSGTGNDPSINSSSGSAAALSNNHINNNIK